MPAIETNQDRTPCCIRRQVSDLGMEDPCLKNTSSEDVKESNLNDLADAAPNTSTVLEAEEEPELDFDDLMSMSTRSSRASSNGGSLALRAMSDSFNNSSFDGSQSYSLNQEGDNSEEFITAEEGNASASSTNSGRRKLPARSGSGYCRGDKRSTGGSSSDRRKYVRSGVAVSAAALREKRRSSILHNSMSQLAASNARGQP